MMFTLAGSACDSQCRRFDTRLRAFVFQDVLNADLCERVRVSLTIAANTLARWHARLVSSHQVLRHLQIKYPVRRSFVLRWPSLGVGLERTSP